MELSFQVNTIASVGADVARKAKRKRSSASIKQESLKHQKLNNALPFTALSPSQSEYNRSATIEEEETLTCQAPRVGPALTTTAPSHLKRKRVSTLEDQELKKHPKLIGIPPRNTSSPTQSKRKHAISIEDQEPNKQQKLEDGSPLNTSSQVQDSLHFLADVALSSSQSRSFTSSPSTSGISTPVDVSSSNFTSRMPTPTQTERSKGGRPRVEKQFPRQKQLLVRTKLRINRPVETQIPCEIWQNIFEHCPSEFLLRAATMGHFNEILQRNEKSWKIARLRQFGFDMPDPPPGTSELQYAELLTGSGCQDCDDLKARRTYWGFQRRWCEECLKQNVAPVKVMETEYAERSEKYPDNGKFFHKIVQCIPGAKYDSWDHYQWIGDYDEVPTWARVYPNGQNLRLCRAKFNEMDMEVRKSSLNSSSTPEEIDAFFEPYIAANKAYVSSLQAIEDWWNTYKQQKRTEAATVKESRVADIKAQALSMDQPLQPEILELCPSFQRSKTIAKPFTENVWSVLKPKIVAERDAAEAQHARITRTNDLSVD